MHRKAGVAPKPDTVTRYLPLINHTPSDPYTVLTAISNALTMTQHAGQKTVPYTCDQQLYKVMIDIYFSDPDRFHDLVPCLGGIHYLQSFISVVGTLACPLGLKGVLGGAFGSIDAELNGKKYPSNVRANSCGTF